MFSRLIKNSYPFLFLYMDKIEDSDDSYLRRFHYLDLTDCSLFVVKNSELSSCLFKTDRENKKDFKFMNSLFLFILSLIIIGLLALLIKNSIKQEFIKGFIVIELLLSILFVPFLYRRMNLCLRILKNNSSCLQIDINEAYRLFKGGFSIRKHYLLLIILLLLTFSLPSEYVSLFIPAVCFFIILITVEMINPTNSCKLVLAYRRNKK